MNTTKAQRVSTLILLLAAAGACSPGERADAEVTHGGDEAILGGVPAVGYPEAALITTYKGGQVGRRCSGAVLAPRGVLTAGYCVAGFDGWEVTAPFANKQSSKASVG